MMGAGGMIRAISYGGGVQSTALLVLSARGHIDYRLALFSNVGDRAEHPATLAYYRDVAVPFAAANGIELVELRSTANGKPRDLYDTIMRDGSRSVGIPVRMSNGAPGRRCGDLVKGSRRKHRHVVGIQCLHLVKFAVDIFLAKTPLPRRSGQHHFDEA